MKIVTLSYLLFFLPLIFAILPQFFDNKKISKAIFFAQFLPIFLISVFLLYKNHGADIFQHSILNNDFSLGLEFSHSPISLTFLNIVIFAFFSLYIIYHDEIFANLVVKKQKSFYLNSSLNIFAIIGIFSSNNLLNLIIFIEIFFLTLFAIFSISRNKKFRHLLKDYFILHLISSLFLLFFALIIYLNFATFNLDLILQNVINKQNEALLNSTLIIFALAIIARFFPIWLQFENLKNPNPFTKLFTNFQIFIIANIGIFLILKFNYIFFTYKISSFVIFFAAIFGAFYSLLKINLTKCLNEISFNFYILTICSILFSLAINNYKSLNSILFYALNFNLIIFSLAIFSNLLQKQFEDSSYDSIVSISIIQSKQSFLNSFIIKSLIFLIFLTPFSFLFYANFENFGSAFVNQGLLAHKNSELISIVIISFIAVSSFFLLNFILQISKYLFFAEIEYDEEYEAEAVPWSSFLVNLLPIIILILIAFLLIFSPEILHNLSIKFSSLILR